MRFPAERNPGVRLAGQRNTWSWSGVVHRVRLSAVRPSCTGVKVDMGALAPRVGACGASRPRLRVLPCRGRGSDSRAGYLKVGAGE